MRRSAAWAAGAAIASLLALAALPLVTIDEQGVSLEAWQVPTGLLALLLATATAAAAGLLAWRKDRRWAWALLATALAQGATLGGTAVEVWRLIPCTGEALGLCDRTTGGLVQDTLVTLDWGLGLALLGAVGAVVAGGLALLAHPEFRKDDRFLRLRLLWGGMPVAERVIWRPAPITVGEADGVTFQLAAAGLQRHDLLRPDGARAYRLQPPRGVTGAWAHGASPPEPLTGDEVAIQPGDAGFLHFDNDVALLWDFIAPSTAPLGAAGTVRDHGLWLSLAAVTAVALLFVLGTALVPHSRKAAGPESLEDKRESQIEITLQDSQPPPPELPPDEGRDEQDSTVGKKAAGEEGRVGRPDEDPRKVTRLAKQDGRLSDKPVDPTQTGVVQALKEANSVALKEILTGGGPMPTVPVTVAQEGSDPDTQLGHGPGGMGFRGTGTGGGDDFGPGRIRGMMPGPDTGPGIGRKAVVGLAPKKTKRVGKIEIAVSTTSGGCDRGDISKQVRSRTASIRACYETRLMARPDLHGKVTVRWTIDGEGRVRDATSTHNTVDDPMVGDCVLRAFRTLRFTKPEAGVCVAQWGFVFSP